VIIIGAGAVDLTRAAKLSKKIGKLLVANGIEDIPKQHIPRIYYCHGHYFSYQEKSLFQQLIYPLP
jgi:hypothetical protein